MGQMERLNTKSFKKRIGTLKPKPSRLDRVIIHSTRVLGDDIKSGKFVPRKV